MMLERERASRVTGLSGGRLRLGGKSSGASVVLRGGRIGALDCEGGPAGGSENFSNGRESLLGSLWLGGGYWGDGGM
jgi:hypothetical protein